MSAIPALSYLVVEDHGFQRWLITNLLEGMGARHVYPVGDGRAALEVLERLGDAIDVVVSDLDMPGMDGMELIRLMAEKRHRASLIVVSAHGKPLLGSVQAMAEEYGVNFLGVISKPLTAQKFEAALRSRQPADVAPDPAALSFDPRQIEAGLRANEFVAFFHPKVEMRTGTLRGAEALVRWRRPYQGIVAPQAFIHTVEASGLVDVLTRRMARAAMVCCRAWHEAGLDLGVSVNLSPLSLSDVGLAEEMRALAEELSLDPRYVTFEITESAAARDLGRKLENLTRLRIAGFGLSIDDFGTGYSSMQRLSRIPFTELKIDQSFVKNAGRDPASRALVESSVELARKLDIEAVAEGVESREQWDALLGLGCPMAQGYFIGEPVESDEFLAWALARARKAKAECGP